MKAIKCALPEALNAMGEKWSFLIVRASFNGLVHFEEFQSTLGIARNILANRLAKLVSSGIFDRTRSHIDRRRIEYRLTDKGKALLPALLALRQWGERFGSGANGDARLVDRRDGQPIAAIEVYAHDGRLLAIDDLAWV